MNPFYYRLKLLCYSLVVILIIVAPFVSYNIWLSYKSNSVVLQDTPLPIHRLLPPKNRKTIRILSIPGGGVYGIIPAHILIYLEKKTGKPINELFDVIIGTSTGSIASVLLTAPDAHGKPRYTAEQVLEFYNNDAKKIFYAPWYHRILTLNGIIGPKYLTSSREKFIKDLLGDTRFDDLLNNVIVPSYGIAEEKPMIFYNWFRPWASHHYKDNFFARDLLLGAISPPYFFAPTVIRNFKNHEYILADAAIYMDNPVMLGLSSGVASYPNHDYLVVSLGTGEENYRINAVKAQSWGLLQWIINIVPVFIEANEQLTQLLLDEYFNSQRENLGKRLYYNINVKIGDNAPMLDDTSKAALDKINALADQVVTQHKAELDKLAIQLQQN